MLINRCCWAGDSRLTAGIASIKGRQQLVSKIKRSVGCDRVEQRECVGVGREPTPGLSGPSQDQP